MCVMTLKSDVKFKGKLTCGFKITQGIFLFFMQSVENLKICTFMGFFHPKHIKI